MGGQTGQRLEFWWVYHQSKSGVKNPAKHRNSNPTAWEFDPKITRSGLQRKLRIWGTTYWDLYGDGSIPIDTFLVGWTSIYQLFWGSLGTRVLTHTHIACRAPGSWIWVAESYVSNLGDSLHHQPVPQQTNLASTQCDNLHMDWFLLLPSIFFGKSLGFSARHALVAS